MKRTNLNLPGTFRATLTSLLVLLLAAVSYGQVQSVKGKIIDENGQPVNGASVRIKGTQTGVVSESDGAFTISAASGSTLLISYSGYLEKISVHKALISVPFNCREPMPAWMK